LKQTLEIARDWQLLKRRDLAEVNVDTTLQPKAVAFPTDSWLYFKMSRALVRQAVKSGIQIRQSYPRVAKGLLVSQSRYAHAKQYGRARRSQVLLRGILGRLLVSVRRKTFFVRLLALWFFGTTRRFGNAEQAECKAGSEVAGDCFGAPG
jgi:IS5 family transposase